MCVCMWIHIIFSISLCRFFREFINPRWTFLLSPEPRGRKHLVRVCSAEIIFFSWINFYLLEKLFLHHRDMFFSPQMRLPNIHQSNMPDLFFCSSARTTFFMYRRREHIKNPFELDFKPKQIGRRWRRRQKDQNQFLWRHRQGARSLVAVINFK